MNILDYLLNRYKYSRESWHYFVRFYRQYERHLDKLSYEKFNFEGGDLFCACVKEVNMYRNMSYENYYLMPNNSSISNRFYLDTFMNKQLKELFARKYLKAKKLSKKNGLGNFVNKKGIN